MPTSLRFLSVSRALCMPTIPWRGVGSKPVCLGFHDHRPLPVAVSLGTISPAQSGGQDAYAAGPAWQHPHVYRITEEKTHDVNIHSRPVHSRGGFVLRDGSRLCRFRKTHRRNHIRPENKGLSAGNGPLRCTAFMRFRGPQALKDNLQDTRGLPMPLVEIEACARCGK